MNYFFKKNLSFLLIFLLIFSAIFANFYKYLETPKKIINFFIADVSSSLWVFSGKIGNSFSFIMRLNDVYYEISNLKNQNQELLSQNLQLKNQLEENKFLALTVDLEKKSKWYLQTAKIMGMDTQNWLSFFLVDIGYNDGLESGLAVITKDKFLVGKITEVNRDFSKVMTIFHPDNKIAVMTQEGHVFGILNGDYVGNLIMDMIDKDKNIAEGEIVVTSGRDGIFPEGLIIGSVMNFQSKPENLFQTANINGFLNIYDLDKVLIVKGF